MLDIKQPFFYSIFKKYLDLITHKIINRNYFIQENNISTLSGSLSRSIFLSELGTEHNPYYKKIIATDIENIVNFIEKNRVSSMTIDGLSGFGWGISNLCKKNNIDADENEYLNDLDSFLLEESKASINYGNFDFFQATVGYINYFFERVKGNQNIKQILKELFNLLLNKIVQKDGLLFFQNNNNKSKNRIDFSLSHGISALIIILTKYVELKVEEVKARKVLGEMCRFVLSHKKKVNGTSRLPDCIFNNEYIYSPLRWCHGELGICLALSKAGTILEDKSILKRTLGVINSISLFKLDVKQEIVSVNICHGTLGIAYVFNKLSGFYKKNFSIIDATNYWCKESAKIMGSPSGYGDIRKDGIFEEKTGILLGIEGMGLVLNSFINPERSSWDSSILLS